MKRKLKIEEQVNPQRGDEHCPYRKETRVPRVRLAGKWLQAAGLAPGQHVEITVIARGVIELRLCSPEFNIVAQRLDHAIAAACEYAAELIRTARQHFPKSMRNADKFQLENTCATIGKAIAKAKGEP